MRRCLGAVCDLLRKEWVKATDKISKTYFITPKKKKLNDEQCKQNIIICILKGQAEA